MLVTPALTFFSLALNFGALMLWHGCDPDLVMTKRNLRMSIQTIESAATESWGTIVGHYKDIISPPPASSASSVPFVDHAEWVYRRCAVRVIHSLGGSVSHSSRTFSPTPAPTLNLPSTVTSLSIPISTDITLHTPLPPACFPSDAPFVVEYVEHPWEAPGFVEVNFPRFWPLAFCILVSWVICVWFKVVRPSVPVLPLQLTASASGLSLHRHAGC